MGKEPQRSHMGLAQKVLHLGGPRVFLETFFLLAIGIVELFDTSF